MAGSDVVHWNAATVVLVEVSPWVGSPPEISALRSESNRFRAFPFYLGSLARRDLEGEAMAASTVSLELSHSAPPVETGTEAWYGLHTRSRHEKIVAQRLEERGVTA